METFLLYLQIFAYATLGAAGMLGIAYFSEKLQPKTDDVIVARFNRKLDKLIAKNKKFLKNNEIGVVLQSAAGRNVCPFPAMDRIAELRREKYDLEIEKIRYERERWQMERMREEITELTNENDGLRQALDDIQTRDKVQEPRKNPPKRKGAKK